MTDEKLIQAANEQADWLNENYHEINGVPNTLRFIAARLRASEPVSVGDVQFDDQGIFVGVAVIKVIIDDAHRYETGEPYVMADSNCSVIPRANVIGILPVKSNLATGLATSKGS